MAGAAAAEAKRITVLEEWSSEVLAEVPQERIVHFKGFGVGKLRSRLYDEQVQAVLEEAVGSGGAAGANPAPGVVVWDGDEFDSDSFTRILDTLLSTRNLRTIAFVYQGHLEGFLTNWNARVGSHRGSITVILVNDSLITAQPDVDLYLTLGREALKHTGAKQVVAVGGGGTAAAEAAASKDEGVQWILFPAHRQDDPEDFGALYKTAVEEGWKHFDIRSPQAGK
eukprot:TRINITY_DN26418_c0_g1_i2.p1 TRINITY_DN26418_c0_g1~~TRINITY_DN26418_c0_g1_i2.p1  ORF type:complete len:225 (-),score=40.80 TRINITY_DN26418_c0_g1_i2:336-1010(-)